MAEARKSLRIDKWWIMGDTDGNYVRWEDDGVTGRYARTDDPEFAAKFNTKDEALREIATPDVQNDLEWGCGDVVPLKVTKTVKVAADL